MSDLTKVASEQLKGFTVVDSPLREARDAHAGWLTEVVGVGPLVHSRFDSLALGFDYLFPVKSLTKRILIVGLGSWTAFIEDMRDQNCSADGYAISRALGCRAFAIKFRDNERALEVFEDGKQVRWVESSDDGDQWHYLDIGAIQPFEDVEEITARRKRDRLGVEAVKKYFKRYTLMELPDWKKVQPVDIWGVERSWRKVEVTPVEFETIRDV